jgi:RNA polymerase sigma factor (sigma-70 family)
MNLDQAAAAFVVLRPRLFGIAYRIVGNAPEAEDIVQDVWLRWQRTDRAEVVDPPAFLATATTRLAINLVRCARRRHETYVASWLSEETAAAADPQAQAERDESIDAAAHLLLERLSPAERATYVLREGFEYPYRQIAETLRIGTPNARQLVKRARDRLSSDRRHPYSAAAHSRLVRALASASRAGELADLEEFLTAGLAEQAA